MPFDDVRKICYDYTVTGIETMSPIAAKPFRFIYTSGVAAERDPAKKPFLMGDYSVLRVSSHSSSPQICTRHFKSLFDDFTSAY